MALGSERANYQKFINQLCDLIGVPEPEAAREDDLRNDYVFERRVIALDVDGEDVRNNYIDCYKRDCFALEAKQSRKRHRTERISKPDLFGLVLTHSAPKKIAWDRMMKQARAQAERYAKALPQEHGWPPFLVIVDVGNTIETYADFTGLGKAYLPFPDSRTHRIELEDLARQDIRDRLRAIWQNPRSLDPAAKRAEVTRDIAQRLARVAQTLEKRYEPKSVALFLMRCLFTAFAGNVGLLPENAFLKVLKQAQPNPRHLPAYLTPLWRSMDTGSSFEPMVHAPIRHFNGGLFKNAEALALEPEELDELITACRRDWRNVEPAIFGTLLENALSGRERGQYGAHFTPRAYVERLVIPAVIEPLMEKWQAVLALAESARTKDNTKAAIAHVKEFHHHLCNVRVLDPACGTGNFLYVALELMKRLEEEVILALEELGAGTQSSLELVGHTVGPQQFLGLEKNPRAVPIAELVIWLGHLQWHLRHRGVESLSEPILKPYKTICECDAVMSWSDRKLITDALDVPISRWDGVSRKTDLLTGHMVPDETGRTELYRYLNPKPTDWPEADFIIGNPPFIAGKDLRQELGDGYAEALWTAYPHIPGGADFVMYWWDKAAQQVREKKALRFGFITTKTITQVFCRRVIQRHLDSRNALTLAFAIPNHPWADGQGTAAVRIALTVGTLEKIAGVLKIVRREAKEPEDDGAVPVQLDQVKGCISADLTVGPDVVGAATLKANYGISSPGMKLHGLGFLVTPSEARSLGFGVVPGVEQHIRKYRNGRDLTSTPRGFMAIDLFGLTEKEVRQRYPAMFQWLFDRVKPERDTNNRQTYKDNWWIFGEPRKDLRSALKGLTRYIVTAQGSPHLLLCYAWQTLWHEAGTYLAHLHPRKTA
jgi:hypothetical protein